MSLAASTPVRVVFFLLAVALLPACASSGPAAPDLDPRLLGVWADLDGATHTISLVDEGYAVGVVDSDGEVFDVVSVTYADSTLTWTYDVPSTGYTVTYVTTSIRQDEITARWENQTGASGDEVLTRQE